MPVSGPPVRKKTLRGTGGRNTNQPERITSTPTGSINDPVLGSGGEQGRRLALTGGVDRPLTVADLRRAQTGGRIAAGQSSMDEVVQGAGGAFGLQKFPVARSTFAGSGVEESAGSGLGTDPRLIGVDDLADPLGGTGGRGSLEEDVSALSEDPAVGGSGAEARLSALVDPQVFASIIAGLDTAGGERIVAVDVADDGSIVVTTVNFAGEEDTQTYAAAVATGGLGLDRDRLELSRRQQELDEAFRRDELRINEELRRIEIEISQERIRVDAQIANGQLALALETQNRIDAREKAGRQLERDLFNANMRHQRDILELERSRFDLDRQQFLSELGSQPGNLLDFFNISRGLPVPGLGGPLPEGINRAVGLNPVQQTFAGETISLPQLPEFGEVAQVGNEASSPASEFDLSQFLASPNFGGASGATGGPVTSPLALPVPGAEQPGGAGANAVTGAGPQPQAGVPNDGGPATVVEPLTPQTGIVDSPESVALAQEISAVAAGQPAPSSGFQLPPEIQAVFAGGLASDAGAAQLPDTGVPFLSPQQLASLTPAAREFYQSLIRAVGLREEDFQFIADQRAPTSGQRTSRRA